MTNIKLVELTLLGNRKNYSVKFHNGFNCISGNTSTGKTSIFEMIDYALGAKKHKSYIEIGNSCTHVQLVLYIGKELFRIQRPLFDFTAQVIVESWDDKSNKFLFYNHYEIDIPKNKNSFAAFLIEKIGLADITIKGQALSSRDILKYCYLKQTEIDNEDIHGEKNWLYNIKRKAVFEILFNIFNEGLEDTKKTIEERKKELEQHEIKLSGIQDFVRDLDIKDISECYQYTKKLQTEISVAKNEINSLKNGIFVETDVSLLLKKDINILRNEIQELHTQHIEQSQYVHKLTMLISQYNGEIDKNRLAIQGYIAFNEYEFVVCPNCLKPIEKNNDISVCCLCGQEKSDNSEDLIALDREIKKLTRKKNELVKHISGENNRLDNINKMIVEKTKLLEEKEFLLNHLTNSYVNPNVERIEQLNYEIGLKYNLIQRAEENLKMFEEIERQKKVISDKKESLLILKNNLKAYADSSTNKDDLFKSMNQLFTDILTRFKYPKLSASYIDDKDYLPYVRGRKYNEIGSSGGVTIITMAYYITIMLLGINEPFYHPGLLMIDSPRKNLGADNKDADFEFKDEEIFNSIMRTMYDIAESEKDKIQLIVINNGYPDFIPKECVVAEFDSDGRNGLKKGLIDDID